MCVGDGDGVGVLLGVGVAVGVGVLLGVGAGVGDGVEADGFGVSSVSSGSLVLSGVLEDVAAVSLGEADAGAVLGIGVGWANSVSGSFPVSAQMGVPPVTSVLAGLTG